MARVSAFTFSAVLLLLAALGCDMRPARPSPFAPTSNADLVVELLAPVTNQTVVAGTRVNVRVRALEPKGLLHGIGFYARRPLPGARAVDSVVVLFSPTDDTTHVFSMAVPTDLAQNTQLDVYGLAFGPASQTSQSSPKSVIVLVCTPSAAWCY